MQRIGTFNGAMIGSGRTYVDMDVCLDGDGVLVIYAEGRVV
jgi:hypothetical protein